MLASAKPFVSAKPEVQPICEMPPAAKAGLGSTVTTDALDTQEIAASWQQFSQPVAGNAPLYDSQVRVVGMVCAACGFAIEQALQQVPGVVEVQLSASTGRARVRWDANRTTPILWLQAIHQAGYGVLPGGAAVAEAERKRQQRSLLWRWLVAGFCMMQIMMYAYPSYVAKPGELAADSAQLLRWAGWVLSLPLMLFSCQPFFMSALRDLRRRSISMDLPVALGILITFGISSAATFAPQGWWGQEVYFDSLSMFVFFLLSGRWLEQRMRHKTAGALEALVQSLPERVERQLPDGSFTRVARSALQAGDVIRVLVGDVFPADGVIVQGSTTASEALLTGEADPLFKPVNSNVIAGSHNLQASVLVKIERTGADTRFGEIVALMEQVALHKPRLAQLADKLARPFLALVLLTALLAIAFWWPTDSARALLAGVAVLVVTCPCALSLATPAAMLAAAGLLAKHGVLIRRLQALEDMAEVDTVIFDKTGTLTDTSMHLLEMRVRPGLPRSQAMRQASALAQHSLHPLSRALLAAAKAESSSPESTPKQTLALEGQFPQVGDVREFPGLGIQAKYADKTQQIRLGSLGFCAGLAGHQPLPAEADLAAQVHMQDASGWMASFRFAAVLKPESASAVRQLQALGLDPHILSGDQPEAVRKVAQAVGIQQFSAACTPKAKLVTVQDLQASGRRVLMVGDGLNDGPVMACANVSIAVGQSVPIAQAHADFVILSGDLAQIPQLMLQARRCMHIVRQNLYWAAGYNALCIPFAVMGWLPAWLAGLGMAGSSLLVVANASRLTRDASQTVAVEGDRARIPPPSLLPAVTEI